MKIVSVHVYLLHLPLTKPYTISYETFSDTEIIFLELTLENGIVGIGASNPFGEVVGETPKMTLQHLQGDFVQQFIGKDIRDFELLISSSQSYFVNLPGTQAAIDIALHDAYGKFAQISVLDYYGSKIKALRTSITIGIKGIDEMQKEAKEYFNLGFRIIKIKTGIDVEQDIERVLKLAEQFGNKIVIRVDANQGYTLKQLQIFVAATYKCTIELIEQPMQVFDENKLLVLQEKVRKILVADESLVDIKSARNLSQYPQPYGVFNIKLMKCGGIKAAREIAVIAQDANIDLFWGCNDESLISITAALHTAYSCKNTRYLDLDGSFDIIETLFTGGFIIKDGLMLPNGLYGLGVSKK